VSALALHLPRKPRVFGIFNVSHSCLLACLHAPQGNFAERVLFTIRPQIHHFIFWLLLSPLLLLEGKLSSNFVGEISLNNPAKRSETTAKIVDCDDPKGGEIYIKYRFQLADDPQWYSASDDLFKMRTDLCTPIKTSTWKEVQDEMKIQVYYLNKDPWVNKPVKRAGNPVGDSLAGWILFLSFDLYWFYELYQIVNNFRECRLAAESLQEKNCRYWKTRELYKS